MIFNGAVSREKLRRNIALIDMSIRFRKGVFPVAKGANPDLGGIIDPGVGVQYSGALGAIDRVIGEDRKVGKWR